MITFKNPQEKIYDLENLDDKIVLVHVNTPYNENYYGIVQKKSLNDYEIKVGSIGKNNDDIHIWGLTGKTVLDIITECYTNSIGSGYEYTFYIIEKMSELRDVLI
jgi:hypothetical protein